MTKEEKKQLLDTITTKLSNFSEISKIIVFGSFVKSTSPNDVDIAIFQNSQDDFLTLSMKYRKVLRDIAKKIPLDILPIKQNSNSSFLSEITNGIVIYEK
jgi:predicted nucleotidyltransferase